MKSPKEIDDLKSNWMADPCWDIEETEGFEDHYEHLRSFRNMMETEWRKNEQVRLVARATHLGCSIGTLKYLEGLEHRIAQLEAKLEGSYQP